MAENKKKTKKTTKIGVKPLADRVLIREVDNKEETKTHSGIYIPENAKKDKGSKQGEVVAVGEGRYEDGKLSPMRVKVGDIVLYSWGENFEYEGEEYTMVRESDIIGIIE